MRILPVLAAALLLAAYSGAQPEVIISPVGNLVEQLDLAGGLGAGNRAAYKAYWDKSYVKTDKDRQMVAAWTAVRRKYEHAYDVRDVESLPFGSLSGSVEANKKLRIAAFRSQNLTEYGTLLEYIVAPRDRTVIIDVLNHFWPTFEGWWKAEGLPASVAFVAKMTPILADKRVADRIAQFRAFYRPQLGPNDQPIFVPRARPKGVAGFTSGEQVERYAVFEFRADEKPESRMPVVLHELCHFLSNSRADEADRKLQEAFIADPSGLGPHAYNLFEEAVATVFGNGLIARDIDPSGYAKDLARKGAFYNNEFIDEAAKVLLPWLDKWLATGRTLDDPAFASGFIAALKEGMGEKLGSPAIGLFRHAAFIEGSLAKETMPVLDRRLYSNIRNRAYGGWADFAAIEYDQAANLSAILVLRPSSLGELQRLGVVSAADLAKIKATPAPLLYALPRKPGVFTYLVVADSGQEASALISTLAEMRVGFIGAALAKNMPR